MESNIVNEIKKMHSLKDLEALKESFNKSYEEWKDVLQLSESLASLKSKEFGYAKDLIEGNAHTFLKENKNILKEYVSIVKGSENLKNLFLLYENLSKINEKTDLPALLNEWKKSIPACTKEALDEDKKKLEKIVCEAYAYSGENKPDSNKEPFYALVESVFTMTPNSKNMAEYYNKISEIKEYAVLANIKEQESKKKVNEEIENILDNSEEKFNDSKQCCLKKLNGVKEKFQDEGDDDSVKKIDEYIDNISKKEYNKDTIKEDIDNFESLSECF